jgi:hypothetical protein
MRFNYGINFLSGVHEIFRYSFSHVEKQNEGNN